MTAAAAMKTAVGAAPSPATALPVAATATPARMRPFPTGRRRIVEQLPLLEALGAKADDRAQPQRADPVLQQAFSIDPGAVLAVAVLDLPRTGNEANAGMSL